MPTAVQALQSIPFRELIGGPLKAAVEAQAMAAESTVEFIERVAFTSTGAGSALRNVTFSYSKVNSEGGNQNFSLTVPLLSILPIPFIRIDEMTIDFSAKLHDITRTTSETASAMGISGTANARWGFGSASMRASASRTRKTTSSSESEAEYNMVIKVRAGAAPMPEGMAKILDILEQVITESASPAAAPPAAA
jgi:hypothetical protein